MRQSTEAKGAEPMKLLHYFVNRRRVIEVLLVNLCLFLQMGEVGVAEVEALERGEETTKDLEHETV
jgi:hypothetical protein